MTDKATIQWLEGEAGIVRIHDDVDNIPGPWSWSCVIEVERCSTVKIHGADRAPTRDEMKELIIVLKKAGFKSAVWDRHLKSGRAKTFKVKK